MLRGETAGEEPGDGEGEDLFTRRALIQRLTFLGGGVVLLGGGGGLSCQKDASPTPRKPAARPQPLLTHHRSFTDEEYDSMAAACERILPRDQDPGAADASVPEYVDRMLQAPELSALRDQFVQGLGALDRRAAASGGKRFSQLSPPEQDALLNDFKGSSPKSGEAHFYELLVVLTLEGFLGDPSYGGNKDGVGWALVGFGTSGPPQGYDGERHLHAHTGHPR
ncbi:MAG TPA: gluconate 2-dehydrogenase subunit 3 family protein [Myxococcales bacterium]|jgi:gluconate 2-dehydrogenase gamma chain|nr:gluconate 2-dehydrogenase subunit 3 family protein [Myxococcales bacterium]